MTQQLTIQQLQSIAEQFDTPVYVYHAEKIAAQYEKLQQAFLHTKARFFYACKALSNINILKIYTSIRCWVRLCKHKRSSIRPKSRL